jgi:hypothetical protein
MRPALGDVHVGNAGAAKRTQAAWARRRARTSALSSERHVPAGAVCNLLKITTHVRGGRDVFTPGVGQSQAFGFEFVSVAYA